MKRYLLFSGENYHSGGGMNDFDKDFDSVHDAIEYFNTKLTESYNEKYGKMLGITLEQYIKNRKEISWFHIFDIEKNIVLES